MSKQMSEDDLDLDQDVDQFDGVDDEDLESQDRGDDLDDDSDADVDADADADSDSDNEVDLETLEELAGTKKQQAIPKPRFDEVNNAYKNERDRRLQLEEENARLRGNAPTQQEQREQKPTVDLDDLEEKWTDAVADGDTALAKELRKQIREEEKRIAREEARQEFEAAENAREQKRAATAMQAAAAEAVQKYSFLNPDSDDYDEESLDLCVSIRDTQIRKGVDPVEAIRIAAAKVARMNGVAVEGDDKPAKKEQEKPNLAQQRKVDAIKRNADINNKQPPRPKGAGETSRAPKDNIPTEQDLAGMTQEQLARERGDYLDDES